MDFSARPSIFPAPSRVDTTVPETIPMQQMDFQVESSEVMRSDTLFSAASRPEFIPRKTEPKDVKMLEKLVTEETQLMFGTDDIGMAYEMSCFSMVLVDQIEFGKIAAHASFSDTPVDPAVDIDAKAWKDEDEFYGITPLNTLFLRMCVFHKEYAPDACLIELVANTFQACSSISFLIVECPNVEYDGPYLFSHLVREITYSPEQDTEKKLILFEKDVMFPHMLIREGREHDLDDLAPQLTLSNQEMEENFNKQYLADLIAMTDRNNQSIVAEFDNEAVGIAIVTTDINYKFLNHHFHLEAFHGLFRPHEDDLVHIEAQQSTLLNPVDLEDDNDKVRDKFIETPRKHRSRVFRREPTSAEELEGIQVKDSNELIDKDLNKTTAQMEAEEKSGKVIEVEELFKALDKAKDAGDRQAGDKPKTRSRDDTELPKHTRSDEFQDEITKSEPSQIRLLQRINEIVRTLQQNGIPLNSSDLDEETLKLLSDAEDLIQQCVNVYLHRVLIDEKVLPMDDWNEPPPSFYMGLPNAIAIQLLTMDKRYNMRISDLIHNTLMSFPNRDYVIVTLPSHLPEPFWTKFFTLTIKRKDSVYPKSLYVLHRASFTTKVRVRIPNRRDFQSIQTFLEPIVGSSAIIQDVKYAIEANISGNVEDWRGGMLPFILEVQDYADIKSIIVGLALISNDYHPGYYHVNYNLDNYAYANDIKSTEYSYIHHFLLSPLFQMYARRFMNEILRRTKKHFAFHKLLPFYQAKGVEVHQSLLNNVEDWIPLAPRKRISYRYFHLNDTYDEERQPPAKVQDYNLPHGTLFFSKKFLFDQKPKVGARLVFVGGSETTIACVEKLIFQSHLTFKHLTIISPNGIPGSSFADHVRNKFFVRTGSPALSMESDDEWHHRLGLRNHVNVVYGTVTKLLRYMKIVVVNGRWLINYDLLVISAGRQFIRPDCPEPEIEDEHFAKFHESINKQLASDYSENRDVAQAERPPLKRLTIKPYNVFLINIDLDAALALNYLREYIPLNHQRHIIVHGSCLEAYCCLNALIHLNIDLKRIVFVTTPLDEMEWEKYHGYRATPKVKELMEKTFERLKIRVLKNYVFRKWKVPSSSNLITRVYFKSPMAKVKSISVSCLAYFPFVIRRVGDEIASVLTECFLPYNDGILIDTAFQTLDPNIWAAGPCTAYNKALCAEKYFHGFYSSYEIGQLVADLIVKKFDPTADQCIINLVKPAQSSLPPLMIASVVRYAELPDGWAYLHMRRPGGMNTCCHGECTCPDCECGTEIVTGSLEEKLMSTYKYFRLWLNSFQRVEGLECISRAKFSPSNLVSLYGHHETLLNKLLDNVAKGDVNDLYTYFEQPWIAALCHDRWVGFREELQDLYSEYDIGTNLKLYNFIRDYLDNLENPDAFKVDPNILRHIFETTGLKERVERKFLEFLKYNRAVLPMYARPDFVEEVYEERKVSPFYFPQVPNF